MICFNPTVVPVMVMVYVPAGVPGELGPPPLPPLPPLEILPVLPPPHPATNSTNTSKSVFTGLTVGVCLRRAASKLRSDASIKKMMNNSSRSPEFGSRFRNEYGAAADRAAVEIAKLALELFARVTGEQAAKGGKPVQVNEKLKFEEFVIWNAADAPAFTVCVAGEALRNDVTTPETFKTVFPPNWFRLEAGGPNGETIK